MFVLLQRICIHVRLGIFGNYVFCFSLCCCIQMMYTCRTGSFGIKNVCYCLCFCRGNSKIHDWKFWQQDYVFISVLFQRILTLVRLGIFANIFLFMVVFLQSVCTHVTMGTLELTYVYDGVVVHDMYTCQTGHVGNEPLFLCLCFYRGYVPM